MSSARAPDGASREGGPGTRMRILMLGWEFPPFISGGLGTACHGLTRALDAQGHEVLFVLPRAVDRRHASHVRLYSPEGAPMGARVGAPGEVSRPAAVAGSVTYRDPEFKGVVFRTAPSELTSVYPGMRTAVMTPAVREAAIRAGASLEEVEALLAAGVDVLPEEVAAAGLPPIRLGADYSGDVVGAAHQYARLVLRLCRHEPFDVIHAHDWMTYPAGLAVARATGVPLVVHVHSTEFDRSGEHVNQRIYDIERRGMHGAMVVACVSEYTRSLVVGRYGVQPDKTAVVYNGIDPGQPQPDERARIEAKDKIVLFLGRITMQKGPEYFIAAAKRVLEKMDNVKFIVAGSGDMARRMIELAAELGIGHKVLFTGFLRGDDVKRVYRMADLYVMPSVSEPFGIAPLEAISNDTPVIISKQSGVSEVLLHALKVDFWDIDGMADKIIAVLRHPPLSRTLREHGSMEIRRLTWESSAAEAVKAYERAVALMEERVGV